MNQFKFESQFSQSEEEISPSIQDIEREEEPNKKYEEYYYLLRPLGAAFSHYGVFGIKIDPTAESFYFDHENKEVAVAPRLIEKFNLTPQEEKWILLHELGHLVQFFQSPKEYLECFEFVRRKGKEKGERYRRAYNNFFNIFSDIHDNFIVRGLMPIYQRGGIEERIPPSLYQEKLFRDEDYTQLPLSQQFLYFIIKKIMAPEASVKISQLVEEIVNSPIFYYGEKYDTVLDFVRERIASPTTVYRDIFFLEKEFLLPLYEKLLEEDEKEKKLEQIPEFLGEFNIDEGLDEETIKKIKEAVEKPEKSPNEKYKDYLESQITQKGREKGFSEKEIKRILEIEERTEKIVRDLEDLWENFIQHSTEYERSRRAGFKTGASISPEKLLSQLPVLLAQPSQAEIFYRYVEEEKKEEIKPKRIVFYLLLDLSGSMGEPKREAVQEVAYALTKSLINFYRTGKLAMVGEEFPISINYRLIGFGSSIQELTEPTPEEKRKREKIDTPERDLDKELWQAIFDIQRINLQGTEDMLALNEVKRELEEDPQIEEKLKEGEEIWIVLEITDGETTTASESKKLVEELNRKPNVFCRAIQIPGPIYSEKSKPKTPEEKIKPPEILPPTGTFKEVWGDEWGKKLKKLSVLKETIVAILYDAIRQRYF